MQAGATLHGRALAQSAVTLIGNTVTSAAPAPVVILPTVITSAASSVVDTTATLNGSITATGGSDATQSGFAFGTDPTLTVGVSTSTIGAQTGDASFVQDQTGLSPSTTYYFRAYATNSAGTGLGSIQSFVTSSTPVPVTTPAPSSVGNSMNSGLGSGGGGSSQTTTVTTNSPVPNLPNTGSAPGLPNTGFAPQVIMSSPWNIIILAGVIVLLVVGGIVWRKRNV